MRNPAARNEMGSKHLSEFLEGIDGTCPQTIDPPHHHRPQAGWKYLAHQGLVLGMYCHPLIEMANMLYRVCSAVIHGESGLS